MSKRPQGLLGIVGNTLYLEPIYAGDSIHEATIDRHTKYNLVEAGVPEFSSVNDVWVSHFGPGDYFE